jgi:ABC-2 type transport system permease protein
MPGLTVATFLTLPALFFLVMQVTLAWSWSGGGPGVLAVAVAGAILSLAVMALSARVAVGWASRLLASRRARLVSLVGAAAGVALVAPAAWLLFRDGFELVLDYDVPVLLDQLGKTPLGAGPAAASAAFSGDVGGATWRLAMLLAWVVILHMAWRANVAYSLVHPAFRGGGSRRRGDVMILAATRAGTRMAPWVPVWARLRRSWATDPRYLAIGAGVLTFPVLFFAFVIPTFGLDSRWAFVAPVLLAASVGWATHNELAHDSTALWMDLVSGRLGRDIMWGRVAAVLTWAVPVVAAAAIGTVLWSGRWEASAALIGACMGVLGVSLGIGAVTSVALPYRAPAPGQNPFSAEVGSVGASLLAQVVSSAATLIALPFVIAPMVLALVWHPAWGWLALVTGATLGGLGLRWALRWAGSLYDRRAGRLLGAVS